MVAGDAVNTAAPVQAAAEPGPRWWTRRRVGWLAGQSDSMMRVSTC
jgi:hypothetical protein